MRRLQSVLLAIALVATGCSSIARSAGDPTPSASLTEPRSTATAAGRLTAVAAESVFLASARAPSPGPPTPSADAPRVGLSTTPSPSGDDPPNGGITPARPDPSSSSRLTFAYYVPYDPTSWWSLQAQIDQISFVAPQWVTIDACGDLGSRDDRTLLAFAHAHGVKVVPTLPTGSGWLNHQILTDPATTQRAIDQSVNYVVSQGYDGLDVDFEGVLSGDRVAFTSFATRLGEALHQHGKLFTMALPAKTADTKAGWGGATDYAALAPSLDHAILMAYEYSGATTAPGSTSPQEWVDRVLAYATSVMPAEKVLLGVAFYGRDWNLTQGGYSRALTYPQAARLATVEGATIATDPTTASGTFDYTSPADQPLPRGAAVPSFSHDVSAHVPPACPIQPPATPPPHLTPTPTVSVGLVQHEVWIENAASVRVRLDLAAQFAVGGVAFWRLGQEDPAAWPVIGSWRRGQD